MPEDVARLLKRHRIAAGLSQEDLARLSGVSTDAISMLERGARRAPYQTTLDSLVGALALEGSARLEFEEAARLARPRGHRGQKRELPVTELLPNNFPPEATSFLGRERELAEIGEFLERHPLVTLVGAGGVGKTRCAIRVGATTLVHYRDGAWLIEFAPTRDPALVSTIIAESLSVQIRHDRPALAALLAYLKRKNLLLVLDNCEHVIGEASSVAAAIMRSCPQVRMLATSREPLRVRGEQVYRISSLSIPGAAECQTADQVRDVRAVQLFVDRARSAKSDFLLSDSNAADVAEICRRLDGIPLALELAAVWVTTLSPKQLAQRLNERFALLTSGYSGVLPRHRTVRALIDWSYDLLGDQERRVFRKLAVFAGDFTFEAAGFVCVDDELDETVVLKTLGSLVDKSLVQACPQGDAMRYRLLETTREFARERLAGTPEHGVAAQRHAAVFLTFAEGMGREWAVTPDRLWLDRVALDIENFRVALSWALENDEGILLGQRLAAALRPVWSHFAAAEGRQWVKAARDLVTEETPKSIAAALDLAEACLATTFSQYKASRAAAERALAAYRILDEPIKVAYARFLLGTAMVKLDRGSEGEALLVEALSEARRLQAGPLTGAALQTLAFARRIAGDSEGAASFQSEALALYREIGAERAAADVLSNSAEWEFRRGDLEAALRLATEALNTYRAFGSKNPTAMALCNIAAYLLEMERFDEARLAAGEALSIALDSQYGVATAFALQRIAATMALRLDVDETERGQGRIGAARLLGYVDARLDAIDVPREYSEQQGRRKLLVALQGDLGKDRTAILMAEGSTWDEDRAVEEAAFALKRDVATPF